PDRDLGQRVAGLDPLARRREELRVGLRAHDLVALELGREELLEVRLVPDGEAGDGAEAGMQAVGAAREHLRALRQPRHVCRRRVFGVVPAVGPGGGAGVVDLAFLVERGAVRTTASRSLRSYAGSSPFSGDVGFSFAICDQSARTCTTEACAFFARAKLKV